ncbi:MAG: hypothetical protein MI923_07085 [Phycisphaerales bacterium]|nr:hypothetical protein [Phycisphaerales bacterium]
MGCPLRPGSLFYRIADENARRQTAVECELTCASNGLEHRNWSETWEKGHGALQNPVHKMRNHDRPTLDWAN